MYESFYGLRERPFDLISDSRFMLLTSKHREVLSALKYGIFGRKGLTLVVGEAGTGKTTVIRKALSDFHNDGGHRIGYLSNPTLTLGEFIEWLVVEYELSPGSALSKARFLRELTTRLTEQREAGRLAGLIVDEAQSLPLPLLEEIRLLSNIETPTEKLFPVVLAGQPELVDRLNAPNLRQLKQRIALRSTLMPLDSNEVAAYLAGRIERAGGTPAKLFTREAVAAITEHSRGIPRVISVIADNALIHGLALAQQPVTREIVEEICRMLDLRDSTGQAPNDFPSETGTLSKGVALETVDVSSLGLTADAARLSVASEVASGTDTVAPVADGKPELFGQVAPRSRFLWWSRSGVRGNVG